MKKENIESISRNIKLSLESYYHKREVSSFIELIFESLLSYSRIDLFMNKDKELSDEIINKIDIWVKDLKDYKPIQQIIGETEFYGLDFFVTENTLIPRSETEELIQLILNENIEEKLSILDIGTGTGCIPICLKKLMNNAVVKSVDISVKAIAVAKQNSVRNNTEVEFSEVDILNWENYEWSSYYDIIVSNPPYVRNCEKEKMHENVLNYEPHLALFVSDTDPLIFYRRISEMGQKYLKEGGRLYFEINEYLAKEMVEMMSKYLYTSIRVIQDIHGRDRIIVAIK